MSKYIDKIRSNWIILGLLSIMAFACETTQETFEDFTKDGEIIYVGTADTVLVGPGYEKLRIWVAINADPKIKKGLLRTNDESVMHEFVVERNKSGKDTISFDIDLPEGEYTFGLFLFDEAGNRSVRREVPATVYGESYQSSLINRGISSIEAFNQGAIINWTDATPQMTMTVLSYEDQEGKMQTLQIANEESVTTVENYKKGGAISVQSYFKPTVRAIEEFEAVPSDNAFPLEYLLDKSIISPLRMAGDASDGCYGSNYDRLTDGSTSEFWHSCEDETENREDLYPWVMGFDLGEPANLSRFRLDEREGCCGERSPAAYQIWGSNDLNQGETVDIDAVSLLDWETDAIQKGWVKILDVTGNTQYTFEAEVPEHFDKYKYVRIVGISSIGGGLVANFSEFTFWGK